MAEVNVTTIVVASLVGGVVSYLGAVWKSAIDFRSKLDDGLVAKRAKLYEALWALTARVPKWPQNEGLRLEHLRELSLQMQRWYFDEGGIYMSSGTQAAYRRAQDMLSAVVGSTRGDGLHGLVSRDGPRGGDYELVRGELSALRSAMTDDLLSRRRASIWWPF